MKIYKVGGVVRDRLLGLPHQDSDWVVVGATPEQMRQLGFKQVGKDFPVFLHPETHEEYALARTERKTAPGYRGFSVHATADVTLEDDLRRRDLTINAMAETPSGHLVDPFGGLSDIENKCLRHVSPAFAEDPVRILRVARFAARLRPLGFQVAEETMVVMHDMVQSGEVDALVPERIWAELVRALSERKPSHFFDVLRQCGALARIFPEVDRLFGVPQRREHHPEVDTGVHTMLVLDRAAALSSDTGVSFAALVHDLGKGTTPQHEWPRHVDHEERSVELINALCERLRVPNAYRKLATLVARYHSHCHRAAELRGGTYLKVLKALDALRRPETLEPFLLACQADSQGRLGCEQRPYPQAQMFRDAYEAARQTDAQSLMDKGFSGASLGKELAQRRIEAINRVLAEKWPDRQQ